MNKQLSRDTVKTTETTNRVKDSFQVSGLSSPEGHGLVPHTQREPPLMAQLCSGMSAVLGTAVSAGSGKFCQREREREIENCAIGLWFNVC